MKAKRTFKSIFWPAFIELLFFMLMGTIDTIMLSGYDDFAVGAVGNANTLINMFAVLILVISSGVAVLVSQHIGANQESKAKKVIGTGIFMNIFIGLILGTSIFLLSKPLLLVVNTNVTIMSDSMTYLRIIAISLAFLAVSNVITGSLRSYGYGRYITYIVVVGNILNIIGNYLLINGHMGLPRLGVFGAGISTLSVRLLMLLIYAYFLFNIIKIQLKDIKIHKESLKNILRIGAPSALESWTYTIMQGVMLSIINSFGPEFTTARTYVNTLLTYVYIFSLAFATANAIMTGYAVGEKDYEKAYKHTLKIVVRSFIFVGIMTLLLNVFSNQILGLFTKNSNIIEIAQSILWIVIFLEIGRATNLVTIQALRSAGDTKFPLIMAIISMIGIAIPMGLLLGKWLGLGLFGIYLTLTFDEIFRGVCMSIRWHSKKWITKSEYLKNTVKTEI